MIRDNIIKNNDPDEQLKNIYDIIYQIKNDEGWYHLMEEKAEKQKEDINFVIIQDAIWTYQQKGNKND